MAEKFLKFPDDFFWGAANSAYQSEGGNFNSDWWHWEKSQKRFEQLKKAGLNPDDFVSGAASDHYNRFEEDFDLAKKLNHNAHRFSIEWARIEPKEGQFDMKELNHYKNVLAGLKSRNLEPFVTLSHFTLPQWLAKQGSWLNKKSVQYFSRYSEFIVKNLSEYVNFWLTINEPEIYAIKSYLTGDWPPQKKSLFQAIKAICNLCRAHCGAYKIIKKINPNAQVGFTKNNTYFSAQNWLIDNTLVKLVKWFWNDLILVMNKNYLDFIGLNYYFHARFENGFKISGGQTKNDLGWEIYPEGIYHILRDLKKYKKPIYITENGLADSQDQKRAQFIKNHLKYIWQAIQEGIDVRGYFYWSLIDNFEWSNGFDPRFGLIYIDYKTQKRLPRKSAFDYAKIIKDQGFIL